MMTVTLTWLSFLQVAVAPRVGRPLPLLKGRLPASIRRAASRAALWRHRRRMSNLLILFGPSGVMRLSQVSRGAAFGGARSSSPWSVALGTVVAARLARLSTSLSGWRSGFDGSTLLDTGARRWLATTPRPHGGNGVLGVSSGPFHTPAFRGLPHGRWPHSCRSVCFAVDPRRTPSTRARARCALFFVLRMRSFPGLRVALPPLRRRASPGRIVIACCARVTPAGCAGSFPSTMSIPKTAIFPGLTRG